MISRYNNPIVLRTQEKGKPYYGSKYYPNVPLSEDDIYVITTIGDRLDSLAYTYYKDPEMWWIIAIANNNATKGSLFPAPGTQLRIPINASKVVELFNQFNRAR